MGEGLSVNKSWTIQVPNSGRTVSQNLWQYSIFPMATAPSVMYPCDGLSNMNDMQLMNFDFNTSNFLDSSTNMIYQLMPMMKQWMAQQAELYQKTMEGISGSTKIKIKTPEDETVRKDGSIDGTKVIKETEINKTITKMATDPTVADRINKEITYKDKDGKEQKTTLLRRLIELSKEYQENPDNPEIIQISKENYELLWDIAGKYSKTGELSRSDYAQLVEIAKNPGGPGAYKADKGGNDDKKTGERPAKNQAVLDAAEAGSPDNYKDLALDIKKSLYGLGTDTDMLNLVNDKINQYNVLEITSEFNKKYGRYKNENIIDAIFDDCSGWGCGNFWHNQGDAEPYVNQLSDSLIKRAENIIKNNKSLNEKDIEALKAACKKLQNVKNDDNIEYLKSVSWDNEKENMTPESRKAISSAYQDLFKQLEKVEEEIYKNEDDE